MTPSFIKSPDFISVFFADGTQETAYADNLNYDRICDAVIAKNWDEARRWMTPAEAVKHALASNGENEVVVQDGVVLLNGEPFHNTLTDRMVDMLNEGFDIAPLKIFLTNLMSNPSFRAVNELYGFLEASKLPITEDGHFLAYKRIRADYTDCYSGKMDNSIGAIVEMPRNAVNEDKNQTCSSGLHFCARSYLSVFRGDRIVVVKINPRDVVSIPTDYSNAKGRACRYEVIQELEEISPAKLERAFDVHSKPARIIRYLFGVSQGVYNTVEEAEAHTGIRAKYITRVLSGERKTTGGFGWEYEVRTDDWAQSDLADQFDDDDDERSFN